MGRFSAEVWSTGATLLRSSHVKEQTISCGNNMNMGADVQQEALK